MKGNRAVATDDSSTPKGSLNEARWSEVIDAAFVVFSEESYESATIQGIAARVGLLKGSLYYYIESKEALLYAVIERSYVEALAWLQDDPALQDGDAPTRMTRFIERWLENVRLQTTGSCSLNERPTTSPVSTVDCRRATARRSAPSCATSLIRAKRKACLMSVRSPILQ